MKYSDLKQIIDIEKNKKADFVIGIDPDVDRGSEKDDSKHAAFPEADRLHRRAKPRHPINREAADRGHRGGMDEQ